MRMNEWQRVNAGMAHAARKAAGAMALCADEINHISVRLGDSFASGGRATGRYTVYVKRLVRFMAMMERQERIERVLGYVDANDVDVYPDAPSWVQSVHNQQVASFGSGNGREEQGDMEQERD